jgi:hypothetical protein
MIFLPAWSPESFLVKTMDGNCTSALWLEFMGVTNFILGMVTALRNELTRLAVAVDAMDLHGLRMFDRPEAQWSMPASVYEFELAVIDDRQVMLRAAA